jgi:hypothetical protein
MSDGKIIQEWLKYAQSDMIAARYRGMKQTQREQNL